jgi:cellulose synthase operon protein C
MSAFPDPLESLPDWAYLAPAAVLTTFAAEELQPLDAGGDFGKLAQMLVEYAEPVRIGPARGRWRLRDDVRRRTLAALGSRERILDALRPNIEQSTDDPTQRALIEIAMNPQPLTLSGRSLEELLGIDRATEWLEAASVEPLPSRLEVMVRLEREKLLAPMRRLAGGFEGRADEMKVLRSYVDFLPSQSAFEAVARFGNRLVDVFRSRPPLLIQGPGGSGKSTLIAKFILDHVDADQWPLAFVLLDFDRQTLDPSSPDLLLSEVVAQVRIQFPDRTQQLGEIGTDISERFATEDRVQIATSAHFDSSSNVRDEVADLLNDVIGQSRQNMLFVVDTFEIVQRRGPSAVFSLLMMIANLMVAVPRLRVVIAGRGALRHEDFPFTNEVPSWTPLAIGGFDADAGRAYLRARLMRFSLPPVSDADIDRLVLRVRGNPLGLRLAAQVFAREGLSAVDETIGRQVLNEAIAEEQIQGLLHARIVEHLESENLKRLANPGLIVRRITAEVIREVLAAPCGISFTALETPESLLAELRNEVSLVDIVEEGTLKHRSDVRLIMLPSLRHQLSAVARAIDDAAVAFWFKQAGPAARAEEIYHRLWRGDAETDLESRWLSEAEVFLEDALDEFRSIAADDRSHIWLSAKLGRELPDDVRQRADQAAWERDVEPKARSLARDGKLTEALRVIDERPTTARTAASPLWLIDIDIRQLQGDTATALALIDAAMQRMNDVVDAEHTLALVARRTAVFERMNRLDDAVIAAEQALVLARVMAKPDRVFTCGVTRCRLARKASNLSDPAITALLANLTSLSSDPAVRDALAQSPALLREAAAELGPRLPSLLAEALDRFGIETSEAYPSMANLPPSFQLLFRDMKIPSSAKAGSGRALRDAGKLLSQRVRDLAVPDQTGILATLASLYAGAVDRLLNQILPPS